MSPVDNLVHFEVLGRPVGKGRPRFGNGRTYTPKTTADAENLVASRARQIFAEPYSSPVGVTIIAIFEPPKSWSKKKRAEHLWRPHEQKPDGDNIAKLVLDAMSGIAYDDDKRATTIKIEKIWGEPARTVIRVQPLPNALIGAGL